MDYFTIRVNLQQTLEAIGIDAREAIREADLILQFASGLSKTQQFLRSDQVVPPEVRAAIDEVVSKRRTRMPLQYCLGESWFMGLRFEVSSAVLIPRADTETLVEVALELLENVSSPVVLDVGTGSGAIAVSILTKRPDSRAVAIDISLAALTVAARNADANKVRSRISFAHQDWDKFSSEQRFDAIISNPPYIPVSLRTSLEPEVADFEPEQALFGSDIDGLGFYRSLSLNAGRFVRSGGCLVVEVGAGQAEDVAVMFERTGWNRISIKKDLGQVPRVVSGFAALTAVENSH